MDGPPTLAIKEANTHLQALHERNVKLEEEVIHLTAMLKNKQQQQNHMQTLEKNLNEKDQEITLLRQQVKTLRSQIQENTKKDLIISQLKRKVKVLNEILKYKSALDSVCDCLEQIEQDFIVDIDNLIQLDASHHAQNVDSNSNIVANGPIVDASNHGNDQRHDIIEADPDHETCL